VSFSAILKNILAIFLSTITMTELDEQLRNLVAQACSHPPGSPQRQKLLTQIIRLTSSRLWRENTPYYQDALQQTWLYFCRNICEGKTGQAYNPDDGTVVTWLNKYLKYRLLDFYNNQNREKAILRPPSIVNEHEIIDPLENVPAPPQPDPILENVEIWAKTDASGELSSIHIKGRPDVNCQVLILKRLPPEVGWKELSEEFKLPIPTLSSFYQRQCLPRLRKFAESEGIL
jgi:DNA-directed RNA polymerase specialized sigma24 family protein